MSLIYIIIFITLGLTILIGSHLLLYFSLVNFFSINSFALKSSLIWLILFLSISFILASFLVFLKDNIFTRGFYLFSGFWTGLFLNLLMAAFFTWIIIGASRFLSVNLNISILALILILVAFGYSIYGVWNARHPKIKNISVTIPNLPEEWKDKKIVQLSDIHIGHINRKKFVERVLGKVNSVNPEMVVITGDMFDMEDGDLDSPVTLINGINSPKGVFFITGNHETYLGLNKVEKDIAKTKAVFVHDQVIDIDGLKLIGIDYPNRMEKKDIVAVLDSLKSDFLGKPNILLYHAPTNIEQIKEAGVNLELCGHTHKGQLFPLKYIVNLIYKGYGYGLHQFGDYTLYVSSGTGSWGPPMRTGSDSEIVVITLN